MYIRIESGNVTIDVMNIETLPFPMILQEQSPRLEIVQTNGQSKIIGDAEFRDSGVVTIFRGYCYIFI